MHMLRVIHGIGVDLAAIHRFTAILANVDKTQRFLRKAFHPSEIDYFHQHVLRKPSRQHAEFLASRWAVKEATFKAFAVARLDFRDIAFHLTALPSHPPPDVVADLTADDTAHTAGDPPAEESQEALPPLPVVRKRATLQFYGRAKRLMEQAGIDAEDCHVSLSHELGYAVAYVLLQAKPPSPLPAPPSTPQPPLPT